MQIVRPEAAAYLLFQGQAKAEYQALQHYLNPAEHPLPEGPQWVAINPANRVEWTAILPGEVAALESGLRVAPHLAAKGLGLTLMVVGGVFLDWYLQHTLLEAWLTQNRFGNSPADWAADYKTTLDKLYALLFTIALHASRLDEINPYSGPQSSIYLFLTVGGKSLPEEAAVTFQGQEIWSRRLGLSRREKAVEWSLDDFSLHIGTHIPRRAYETMYRRIYRDEYHDGSRWELRGIRGTLHYSPQAGLVLPPMQVEDLIWI